MITLEDVVYNLLLPVLSDEDLQIKDQLFSHFSGRIASPGDKPARMGKWVMNLSREKDKVVRQAEFLALWLGKFFFNEYPEYRVKSVFFPLAIRLAQGAQYPLAPMFLGHVYS